MKKRKTAKDYNLYYQGPSFNGSPLYRACEGLERRDRVIEKLRLENEAVNALLKEWAAEKLAAEKGGV